MQTHLVLVAALFVPVTTLCAADGYPEFRWDRVPSYAHLSIRDRLKPEQYGSLTDHFDLITFQAGGRINGNIEPNLAAGARAIKQRNPRAKVLFYWSCAVGGARYRPRPCGMVPATVSLSTAPAPLPSNAIPGRHRRGRLVCFIFAADRFG